MAENDVLKMKVADLKRELKLRGLPTNGNKNELQERLQTALLEGDLSLEDTAIAEGLLDDDALTDEEDKGLDLANEDAVLQSPEKDEDKSIESSLTAQQQQKKVVLKRKSITLPPDTPPPSAATTTSADSQPAEKVPKVDVAPENTGTEPLGADGTKKVIKLSELSLKDRLEMRAKKFGAGSVQSDAKSARAARFGGQLAKADNATASNGATTNPATMDVLKKRAERFGVSVSSRMVELERKEKLLKRQERFGASGGSSSSKSISAVEANGANSNPDYAEKAKQRLERFKTAVK